MESIAVRFAYVLVADVLLVWVWAHDFSFGQVLPRQAISSTCHFAPYE